jgi:signal transduction histidine kinase
MKLGGMKRCRRLPCRKNVLTCPSMPYSNLGITPPSFVTLPKKLKNLISNLILYRMEPLQEEYLRLVTHALRTPLTGLLEPSHFLNALL